MRYDFCLLSKHKGYADVSIFGFICMLLLGWLPCAKIGPENNWIRPMLQLARGIELFSLGGGSAAGSACSLSVHAPRAGLSWALVIGFCVVPRPARQRHSSGGNRQLLALLRMRLTEERMECSQEKWTAKKLTRCRAALQSKIVDTRNVNTCA
jgi:hypothetical protein